MNFIGHTRFSVYDPQSPSWRLSRKYKSKDLASYKADLFSDARLKTRADIFINYSLPVIDAAIGNHHLVHIVNYSPELPERYQKKLKAAEDKYDWLLLDEQTGSRKSLDLDTFAKSKFGTGAVYAEYRLDDDDLLSATYFDQLVNYIRPDLVGYVVSLGLGIESYYQDGIFYLPRVEHRPKIAIGLARICEVTPRGVRGPKRAAHTSSDLWNPTIVDSRQPAFLHTFHSEQDSSVDKPFGDFTLRARNHLGRQLASEAIPDLNTSFPFVNFSSTDGLELPTRKATVAGYFTRIGNEVLPTLTTKLNRAKRRVFRSIVDHAEPKSNK